MDRLGILLPDALDRYEPHVRLRNRLGIVAVILVALDERLDELLGDQPDVVALGLQPAPPDRGDRYRAVGKRSLPDRPQPSQAS